MLSLQAARFALAVCLFALVNDALAASNPLSMPKPGHHELRVISPTVLELYLVTTKAQPSSPITQWDLVHADGKPNLPAPNSFSVTAKNQQVPVTAVGFKRRVLYAPLKVRDLRIGNYIYLELAKPLPSGTEVAVTDNRGLLKGMQFKTVADPLRYGPAIHANQTGYLPGQSKKAMIGYYLGSLGEIPIKDEQGEVPKFALISTADGTTNFQAQLKLRSERGFTFNTYKRVYEADFTEFNTPGEYRLFVPGLGTSFPFRVGEEVAGWTARTYALGLYHQRCGTNNVLPYTRFTRDVCHAAHAAVPDLTFTNSQEMLEQSTDGVEKITRHTAPRLTNFQASLYPFVRRGKVDVTGGHHDAGDYSKYTINSAGLIHHLMTAVDGLAGVAELDNLGIPESGDGKSDVLQEAKWEADFLAKMQDDDGGFYFLVYPQDRRYENDVVPEKGDPQLVWPKTTSVTAASVAALAQAGSSPTMKAQFPEAAKLYLAKARKGWEFLMAAIAKHGDDGAYQKITHYGHEFFHDDEIAWAACELFLATGEEKFHKELSKRLDPSNPAIRKWTWLRMYEGYGCAIRSYALAKRAGKASDATRPSSPLPRGEGQGEGQTGSPSPPVKLDPTFLRKCENELLGWADELMRWSDDSSYGTSFPAPTKRVRAAGWYFSGDQAFDLAVAMQLDFPKLKDPRPKYMEAILANVSYEAGCNPVNITLVTGLGWKRQREIVHQVALNDRRVLPPSGVPLGSVQAGFGWIEHYKQELGALTFPQDSAESAPYPFYDRWGDSFNLSQEFVVLNQAKGFAAWAWLFAQTKLAKEQWKPAVIQIARDTTASEGRAPSSPKLRLKAVGADLSAARILWEADGAEPAFGPEFTLPTAQSAWAEAEILLPDGRLAFASTNFANGRPPARTAAAKTKP
jgi:hypothetical protein